VGSKMHQAAINPNNRATAKHRRDQFAAELADLREKALAELEARGYAVRGKTPAQIRKILKGPRLWKRRREY